MLVLYGTLSKKLNFQHTIEFQVGLAVQNFEFVQGELKIEPSPEARIVTKTMFHLNKSEKIHINFPKKQKVSLNRIIDVSYRWDFLRETFLLKIFSFRNLGIWILYIFLFGRTLRDALDKGSDLEDFDWAKFIIYLIGKKNGS